MKITDFSQPRRMSKSAFVIFFVKTLRTWMNYFFLFLIYEFFRLSKDLPWYTLTFRMLGILGASIALAAVMAFLSFYFKRYYVENGNLIFMHGVLRKQTTSMPLHKIQSTRTQQGLIYRLLNMKGISFDTLASKSEEVEMILDEEDWVALLSQIEKEKNEISDSPISLEMVDHTENETPATNTKLSDNTVLPCGKRFKFSNLNIIKGAFCQNHLRGAMLLVGVAMMIINELRSVDENMLGKAIDYADAQVSLWSWSQLLMVIAGIYLGMLLLWTGKIFLRYFDMDLRIDKQQLFFESGLLSRKSSQFAHNKIRTVYVKQNFLERALGCSTLMLRQALNATDSKEGSDVVIYGSNVAPDLLHWWLGSNYTLSPQIAEARSGNGLIMYVLRFPLLLCLVACIVLCHFQQYIWQLIPVLYLLITVWRGFLAAGRSRIVLKQDYVEVHTGQLAAELHYCKYEHIEVVRLVASPFTPIGHRVSLHLSTNGTSYVIRSLKENEARYIYELLLLKGYRH